MTPEEYLEMTKLMQLRADDFRVIHEETQVDIRNLMVMLIATATQVLEQQRRIDDLERLLGAKE